MVDADGFYWREVPADDEIGVPAMWSMCPTNPDNSPIPEPFTYYVPEGRLEAAEARVRELEDALVQDGGHPVLEVTPDPDGYGQALDEGRRLLLSALSSWRGGSAYWYEAGERWMRRTLDLLAAADVPTPPLTCAALVLDPRDRYGELLTCGRPIPCPEHHPLTGEVDR
jgi:hypothetical protein